MQQLLRALFAVALLAGLGSFSTAQAHNCRYLAFEVNDYGKEGPTKDAKRLLDGYVDRWAVEQNRTVISRGKKTVDCRLFLDFVVFDEWTCKARQRICSRANPS